MHFCDIFGDLATMRVYHQKKFKMQKNNYVNVCQEQEDKRNGNQISIDKFNYTDSYVTPLNSDLCMRQEDLILELVQSGYEEVTALYLVQSLDAKNMGDILGTLILNEKSKMEHTFLPLSLNANIQLSRESGDKKNDDLCILCGKNTEFHQNQYQEKLIVEKQIAKFLKYQQLAELAQKDPLLQQMLIDLKLKQVNSYQESSSQSPDVKQIVDGNDDNLNSLNLMSSSISGMRQSLRISIKNRRSTIGIIKINCLICFYSFTKTEIVFFNNQYHDTCLSCFQNFLENKVFRGEVLEIKCPHCDNKIDIPTVQKHITNQSFQKFMQFYSLRLLEEDQDIWYCPYESCSGKNSFKTCKKKSNYLLCKYCNSKVCEKCQQKYHRGIQCNQHIEKLIQNWKDSNDIKNCPKCFMALEKVSGCNHITCYKCQYEFCWICNKEYKKDHFDPRNQNGCPGLLHARSFKGKVTENLQQIRPALIQRNSDIQVTACQVIKYLFSCSCSADQSIAFATLLISIYFFRCILYYVKMY